MLPRASLAHCSVEVLCEGYLEQGLAHCSVEVLCEGYLEQGLAHCSVEVLPLPAGV